MITGGNGTVCFRKLAKFAAKAAVRTATDNMRYCFQCERANKPGETRRDEREAVAAALLNDLSPEVKVFSPFFSFPVS